MKKKNLTLCIIISTAGGTSHACNVHSAAHEGPHGGCGTTKSHILFDGSTGLHFQAEWNTSADFDISSKSQFYEEISVDNPLVDFNSNQAKGFHTGDENGKIVIAGSSPTSDYCSGKSVARSCEQISLAGLVPDGTYHAQLESFGGKYNLNTGERGNVAYGQYEITPVLTGGLYAAYNTHNSTLTERGSLISKGDQSDILSVSVRSNPAVSQQHAFSKVLFPGLIMNSSEEIQLKHLDSTAIARSRIYLDGLRTGHVDLDEAIYYTLHYRGEDNGTPPPVAVDASQLTWEGQLNYNTILDYDKEHQVNRTPYYTIFRGNDIYGNKVLEKNSDTAVHGGVTINYQNGAIFDSKFEYNLDSKSDLRNDLTEDTANNIIDNYYSDYNNYLFNFQGVIDYDHERGEFIVDIAKENDRNYLIEGVGFDTMFLGEPNKLANGLYFEEGKSYTKGGGSKRTDDLKAIKDSIPIFNHGIGEVFFTDDFFNRSN